MASRTCHTERLLLLLTRLQSRERIAYGANASLTDRFAHRPRQIVLSAAITPTIDRVTYPNFFSSASFTDRVAFRTYRLQTAPFTDRTAHRPHRLQTVPGRAVRLHDLHHRLCDFSELILLPNFSPTECPSYRTHRLRIVIVHRPLRLRTAPNRAVRRTHLQITLWLNICSLIPL